VSKTANPNNKIIISESILRISLIPICINMAVFLLGLWTGLFPIPVIRWARFIKFFTIFVSVKFTLKLFLSWLFDRKDSLYINGDFLYGPPKQEDELTTINIENINSNIIAHNITFRDLFFKRKLVHEDCIIKFDALNFKYRDRLFLSEQIKKLQRAHA
jgi:hypothetical protein